MTDSAPKLDDFMPGGRMAAPADGESRKDLVGLTRAELAREMESLGEKRFRADQIFNWIYFRGVTGFEAMTDISRPLRARLEELYRIGRPQVVTAQVSSDGTRKWLLRLADGNEVETVFIPEPGRGTLCISSQVGCTLTCSFCHTGTQAWVRNLTAAEIAGQVLTARDELGEWPTPSDDRQITNVVLMGMGEPLFNYDHVKAAVELCKDEKGLNFSRRRITLSTSGIVPEIRRAGAEMQVMLAISLHAARDELRDELVPVNKRWPIKELLAACRDYPSLSNARRITFEYVMLKGVNDADADARELLRVLEGIPSKINLIPFNPWPGSRYETSEPDRVQRFGEIIRNAGIMATIRRPRGSDIAAACGQLKSESARVPAWKRRGETKDGHAPA
ncbi:MAG: 23S rRNA (adenine(2503)-C(2))-methyltransferase RlmN [Alphaproteobacteria bacterium]|nr:23S rRNA (adenine(2503)-C(2))-methyltransferase RlmN [Alphaproteobacteria bacterium]